MTPEELEELRALAGRLSGTAYNENLAAILGAALEHIHKQDARIAELESRCIYDPESGKIFVPDGHPELARLRSQVAALQKIAVSERANTLFNGPWDGGLPVEASYDATMEKAKEDARHQLSEEHPEVDWK